MSYELEMVEYSDYGTTLVVLVDGKKVDQFTDIHMEPEDATFGRDLSWFVDEIQRAYDKGLEDGKAQCGK